MICHVMMMSFQDRKKVENIALTRDTFTKVAQDIDELVRFEIQIDPKTTPGNADLLIKTVHRDKSFLAQFLSNPSIMDFKNKVDELLINYSQIEYETI